MSRKRYTMEPELTRLPRPQAQPISPTAFMACPMNFPGMTLQQFMYQQYIYQKAMEEAQAVVRPSLPERDILGCWN